MKESRRVQGVTGWIHGKPFILTAGCRPRPWAVEDPLYVSQGGGDDRPRRKRQERQWQCVVFTVGSATPKSCALHHANNKVISLLAVNW